MKEFFEFMMLVCFGLSWPVSVWKSYRTRSTSGKSILFMGAIIFGYISGIIGKIIGGQFNYVLIIYCINLFVVSLDVLLYFRNKRLKSSAESKSLRRCNNEKQFV